MSTLDAASQHNRLSLSTGHLNLVSVCVHICVCVISFCVSELYIYINIRGVTIHQWHGSVRFTVLEPRFGSVRFGVGVGFMSSYQQY